MRSLSAFVSEHETAIGYDLLTKTQHDINDLGGALSWSSFYSFVHNLGADSATFRTMNPEYTAWDTRIKTNQILADIYDVLAMMNANIVAIGTRKAPKKPKLYPRPRKENNNEHTQKFGRDGMKPDDLRAWFAERREHGKRND